MFSSSLRNGSTNIGTDSARLAANTFYQVGLHQKRGTGGNAVLEAYVAPLGQTFGAPFASISNGSWTDQATFIRFGATMSAALNARFDDIILTSQAMPKQIHPNPGTEPNKAIKRMRSPFLGVSVVFVATGWQGISSGTLSASIFYLIAVIFTLPCPGWPG